MKVILTEEQLKRVISEEIAGNQAMVNPRVAYAGLMKALSMGNISMEDAIKYPEKFSGKVREFLRNAVNKLLGKDAQVTDKMKADAEEQAGVWKNNYGRWKLVSDDTLATVYNAIPAQCNKDVVHTASMFKLNLADVLSQRVIAMERTFMAELGLKYGDIVYVDGTEKWDGPWQIQDTMNKRFAGMHKIDILVPRNIRAGKWDGVKISVPADPETAAKAKSIMKGSA
jgi:uncharacterized cupin superfamily protein